MAQHRDRWRVWQRYMDAEHFVFLDATAATTAMTRLSGWAPKGERLVDAAPAGHWKTTTFIAGLRSRGLIAPLVLDGPMTGEVFRAYVEQMLAPALEPGDVVVMDNLPAHKVAGVQEAIQAAHRQPTVSAVLQPGPQPDRAALRQAQGAVAQGCGADQGRALGHHRLTPRCLHARRVRQLPR